MTTDIIRKLTNELNAGVSTEVQAVYVLAGIRKIIERDERKDRFPWLNFHCDWALHPHLDRRDAKAVLKLFDKAQPFFKNDTEIGDFPDDLRREIDHISKLSHFKRELSEFLAAYGLPPLAQPYGWTYFEYLYSQVISDIPLKLNEKDASLTAHISKVVVTCQLARQTMERHDHEEQLFKVSWNIYDKAGNAGEYFVLNSFTVPRVR